MGSVTDLRLRVNGRAPAWPVLLGENHPFYPGAGTEDLGSVSFSLLSPGWELLIDAGHHTVPFLLQHGNRIPDAVLLTHGHPDHILGLDWVVQSYIRKFKKSIPLYASQGTYEMVVHSYPHLTRHLDLRELIPGIVIPIEEANGLPVISFPTFHGPGAWGSSMLYFDGSSIGGQSILLTGDMLCPMLTKEAAETVRGVPIAFIDANCRFPFPKGNHNSISPFHPNSANLANQLVSWRNEISADQLLEPHLRYATDSNAKEYFSRWTEENTIMTNVPHAVLEFSAWLEIGRTGLVHYWGVSDVEQYGEDLMQESELLKWVDEEKDKIVGCNTRFFAPRVGEIFHLCS